MLFKKINSYFKKYSHHALTMTASFGLVFNLPYICRPLPLKGKTKLPSVFIPTMLFTILPPFRVGVNLATVLIVATFGLLPVVQEIASYPYNDGFFAACYMPIPSPTSSPPYPHVPHPKPPQNKPLFAMS